MLVAAPARSDDARTVGGELNVVRWKEDYRFLRDRPAPTALERLKFIPLNDGGSAYLTLGGQIRERVEAYQPSFFGLPGGPSFTSYATRLLVDADLHLGPRFRAFTELGSFWEDGREPASRPIDVGHLELQQGFVELVAASGPRFRLTFRVGRQELPIGSGRLVSIRDASNVRLSFDAAKVIWEKGGQQAIELAFGRPVDPKPGVFDSVTSRREWFWYGDWTIRSTQRRLPNAELFVLGREQDRAVYARGPGRETRHTVGGRLWGRLAPIDYSVQASYQFGSFGSADIRAWGVASDTGWTIAGAPGRPRVGLRADIASGDRAETGILRCFNAPYPALNYFSEAAIFAPANAYDLHPYVQAEPVRKLVAGAGVDFLWRLERTDAIYRAGGGILVPAGASAGRFVTAITQFEATWLPLPQIGLRAAMVWASTGQVLRDVGGRNSRFLLLAVDLRL